MSTEPNGLRIAGAFQRGEPVVIWVDGEAVGAYRGESVAAALLAAGRLLLRLSPRGNPRGAFCYIGVCQECTIEHAGRAAAACQLPCEDGMMITLRTLTDEPG